MDSFTFMLLKLNIGDLTKKTLTKASTAIDNSNTLWEYVLRNGYKTYH